jgi:hypothetical protein
VHEVVPVERCSSNRIRQTTRNGSALLTFRNMTKTELNTFRMRPKYKQAELASGNRNRELWPSRRVRR